MQETRLHAGNFPQDPPPLGLQVIHLLGRARLQRFGLLDSFALPDEGAVRHLAALCGRPAYGYRRHGRGLLRLALLGFRQGSTRGPYVGMSVRVPGPQRGQLCLE